MTRISKPVLDAIAAAARAALPRECCGALFESGGVICAAQRIRNEAARSDAFEFSPIELMRAERAGRAEGLFLAGYFHSHVHGAPIVSGADRSGVVWPALRPNLHLIWTPRAWALYRAREHDWERISVIVLEGERCLAARAENCRGIEPRL